MQYRMLGATQIRVSEVGLGCGFLGHAPNFDFPGYLAQALDLGVTFYDTADFYGQSEVWLGEAFRRKRDKVSRRREEDFTK